MLALAPPEQTLEQVAEVDVVAPEPAEIARPSRARLPAAIGPAPVAAARAANNSRLAAASLEQLLTKQPGNGTLWLDLAQELSVATPINDSDGYTLPSKLIGAALKAALRPVRGCCAGRAPPARRARRARSRACSRCA